MRLQLGNVDCLLCGVYVPRNLFFSCDDNSCDHGGDHLDYRIVSNYGRLRHFWHLIFSN